MENALAVGDLVASRDAFTGAKTFRPVTDLFRRTAPGIVHVTLDGPDGKRERLDVTSEHPLFAEGKGWTQVRRLQKGDRVLSGKGGPLAVADIVHDNTPTLVYNFEVAQDHSYFAGSEGAWSHNGAPGWFWKKIFADPRTPSYVKGWIQRERNQGREWWEIRNPPGMDCGHHPTNRGPHDERSRLEWASDNRARPGITDRNRKYR